jgi:hypothetical protein
VVLIMINPIISTRTRMCAGAVVGAVSSRWWFGQRARPSHKHYYKPVVTASPGDLE